MIISLADHDYVCVSKLEIPQDYKADDAFHQLYSWSSVFLVLWRPT